MHRAAVLAAVALLPCSVRAADGPECFSKAIRLNVCEKAREYQAEVAGSLPMRINRNIVMASVIAAGPRLIITAFWDISKEEYGHMLVDSGAQTGELAIKMEIFTRNGVCTQPWMAAFVRLGGEIQYVYKTRDGFTPLAPLIADCPKGPSG